MQQREVEIINKLGLHARASAKLTQLAARYQCDVSLPRTGRKVNAKSIMGVMMLAAGKGSRIMLETDGPDETEAMDAIAVLIGDCFGAAQRRTVTPRAICLQTIIPRREPMQGSRNQ